MPCNNFFLKMSKYSRYGGVRVSCTHAIFMSSADLSSAAAQEIAQELLVCSLQSCTWGKFIWIIPGNTGKSNPFAGGSDEVTEAHQRKSIFWYVAPMQGQFSLQLPPWRSQWHALKFISINSWLGRRFLLPRLVLLLHPLHNFSAFRLSGWSSTWLILPWGCFLAGFGAKGGLKQPQRAAWGRQVVDAAVPWWVGQCSCWALFRALPQCTLLSHPTVLNLRGGRCNLRQLKAEQKTRMWGKKHLCFSSTGWYKPGLWLCPKSWAAEGEPQAAERCCPKVSVCSGCAGNLPCWDTPLVPQWGKLGEEEGLGRVCSGAVGPSTDNSQVMSSSMSLSHQTQCARQCRSCHTWRRGICTGWVRLCGLYLPIYFVSSLNINKISAVLRRCCGHLPHLSGALTCDLSQLQIGVFQSLQFLEGKKMPGCFHAAEHLMRELALPDCTCHSTVSPAIETLICDYPDSTEQRLPHIVM